MVERNNGFFRNLVLPGHRFESPADFNTQIGSWLTEHSNRRNARAIGRVPVRSAGRRCGSDGRATTVPPRVGIHERRLARDYCVPVAGNDYSVHRQRSAGSSTSPPPSTSTASPSPPQRDPSRPPGAGESAPGNRARYQSHPQQLPGPVRHRRRRLGPLTKAHAADDRRTQTTTPYRLSIVDEIGYLPFDIRHRRTCSTNHRQPLYEQGSILITSNMPFGPLGQSVRRQDHRRSPDRPPRPPRQRNHHHRRLYCTKTDATSPKQPANNHTGVKIQPSKRDDFSRR